VAVYRLDIPPHVAEILRHLLPEVKRPIKSALQALSRDPALGEPLLRELGGSGSIASGVFASSMPSIVAPSSFGSLPSATDGPFTKRWPPRCALGADSGAGVCFPAPGRRQLSLDFRRPCV
jgi:hypothetical protein